MSDTKVDVLASSGVEVMRSVVADWDTLSRQFDSLSREHGESRARLAALEQQHRDLLGSHEHLRRAREEGEHALADLQAKHAALLHEHEELVRSHGELVERHASLREDRAHAAGELEALLQRLRP
jgi:chromosome segregation ATPase